MHQFEVFVDLGKGTFGQSWLVIVSVRNMRHVYLDQYGLREPTLSR
jgi:hypothetical protein